IVELPKFGILATESTRHEGFTLNHHSHEHFQVLYVQSGEISFSLKGHAEVKTLRPGSVACVGQGVDHYLRSETQAVFFLLAISADFCQQHQLDNAWMQLATWAAGQLDPMQTLEISRRFQRILLEQASQRMANEGVIVAETLLLITELARTIESTQVSSNTMPQNIQHVLSLLEERLYEPWDLDKAAERCHISRRQFTTLFKQHTGTSFLSYLTTLRLNFAQRLLTNEGNTIAGAAFSSGFSDLSHFYRVFKKEFGVAPGAWLKQQLKD
ncbi:MAG: helix-turn-helix transcriptional regulator, partial [Planctomycetes bacterium]|nr:helix-turn-helix transcriptional regulator [Planctomycetota bacterium]